MIALLDANVLIALIDPTHIANNAAQAWFGANHRTGWATCPLTENAVMRIIGNPRYLNSPGSPAIVSETLQALTAMAGHEFWPDTISLIDHPLVDISRLGGAARITDTYLLALAVSRGGKLATLDQRLSPVAVTGGAEALCIITPYASSSMSQ